MIEFLDNYTYSELDNPITIDKDLAKCALGEEFVTRFVSSAKALKKVKTDSSWTVITELYYAMGGYNSFILLSTYNFNGDSLKHEIIAENGLEAGGGQSANLKMINDLLLEVETRYLQYDQSSNEE